MDSSRSVSDTCRKCGVGRGPVDREVAITELDSFRRLFQLWHSLTLLLANHSWTRDWEMPLEGTLVLPVASSVTLGKLLTYLKPEIPHSLLPNSRFIGKCKWEREYQRALWTKICCRNKRYFYNDDENNEDNVKGSEATSDIFRTQWVNGQVKGVNSSFLIPKCITASRD